MRLFFAQLLILFCCNYLSAQTFIRSELPTSLSSPWEMTYGADGFLWITESGGKISRVDPANGNKTVVYTAADYFSGSVLEQNTLCNATIGVGTLGMALHPDFLNPIHSFIYYVYSYNSGTTASPATKFKIARLTWNASSGTIISDTTVVSAMPSGYDHFGGRLMIIPQNGIPYLFFTLGDHGISEINSPACYSPQSTNPNNFTQDPTYKNGKVHRFNLDGSIPSNNPLPGNSFYTRGHRNPQGLMYNPVQNVIYDTEHGDRSDDEINILEAGMNYGWKFVRGFHSDNNYPGELNYINTYTPYPGIVNDALKEPLYAWCSTPQPTISTYLDWCTVAPSDGIYYGSTGIPTWNNSLLVVTLKNGSSTDQEVFQFKLNSDGKSLVPSTSNEPNPKKYFGEDQALNGRLRDIALSPDGTKIYLINNFGSATDKITVYSYDASSGILNTSPNQFELSLFPNPSNDFISLRCTETITGVQVYDLVGQKLKHFDSDPHELSVKDLPEGAYFVRVQTLTGKSSILKFIRVN